MGYLLSGAYRKVARQNRTVTSLMTSSDPLSRLAGVPRPQIRTIRLRYELVRVWYESVVVRVRDDFLYTVFLLIACHRFISTCRELVG